MRVLRVLVLPSSVVGWFVGVAFLEVYVLPWHVLHAVLNAVAERHTCTVTETIQRGMYRSTIHGYEHRLSCVDGRDESFTTILPDPAEGVELVTRTSGAVRQA
jgi:hypothetical protein